MEYTCKEHNKSYDNPQALNMHIQRTHKGGVLHGSPGRTHSQRVKEGIKHKKKEKKVYKKNLPILVPVKFCPNCGHNVERTRIVVVK